jgi:hypothetical protein
MTTRLQPFHNLGYRFKDHFKAEKRLDQWDASINDPSTGFMPPPCPNDPDMRLIDEGVTLQTMAVISQLLKFPHWEVITPTHAVAMTVQKYKITARISTKILKTFARFSATGSAISIPLLPGARSASADPFHKFFVRCALDVLDVDPSIHPNSQIGVLLLVNKTALRKAVTISPAMAAPVPVPALTSAPIPIPSVSPIPAKRAASRAPGNAMDR